jgi:hypothetical protein
MAYGKSRGSLPTTGFSATICDKSGATAADSEQERALPTQPRQPVQNPLPAPDADDDKGAYGARINQLFRDAIRDLDELKQTPSPEPPD